jgi:hypothetical protein
VYKCAVVGDLLECTAIVAKRRCGTSQSTIANFISNNSHIKCHFMLAMRTAAFNGLPFPPFAP